MFVGSTGGEHNERGVGAGLPCPPTSWEGPVTGRGPQHVAARVQDENPVSLGATASPVPQAREGELHSAERSWGAAGGGV